MLAHLHKIVAEINLGQLRGRQIEIGRIEGQLCEFSRRLSVFLTKNSDLNHAVYPQLVVARDRSEHVLSNPVHRLGLDRLVHSEIDNRNTTFQVY